MDTYTKDQLQTALHVALAVSKQIKQLGQVPAISLFAMLDKRMDVEGFQSLMTTLENQGLISYGDDDLITWVGPANVKAITNGAAKSRQGI